MLSSIKLSVKKKKKKKSPSLFFFKGHTVPGQHLALYVEPTTIKHELSLAECGIIRDKTRLGRWQGRALHA